MPLRGRQPQTVDMKSVLDINLPVKRAPMPMPVNTRRFVLGIGFAAFVCVAPVFASPRTDTPSGLPVPRFVSAKFNELNGRAGPGSDYPIRFIYKKRGLPLMITAETDRWRRVQDPDGEEVWVHARTVDGKRTVMVRGGPNFQAILRKEPNEASPQRAMLAEGVIANLEECRGPWCRVEAKGIKGWVLARGLWGASVTKPGS